MSTKPTTTTNTTTTNTTRPANTTTTNTTRPANTTIAPSVKPAVPISSNSITYGPGDWFGSLFNYLWTSFLVSLYRSFISWWWIPFDAILLGSYDDIYNLMVPLLPTVGMNI